MTICELSERYKIDIQKLQYFADNHLIAADEEYSGKTEKQLGILCTLYDVGLNADAIKQFLLFDSTQNHAGKIKLLNMRRADLLEDIHLKQKSLDRLDYMLYEIKNKGGKTK